MKRDKDATDAILSEAVERFERIQGDDKDNRDSYKSDMAFVYSPGAQWPSDVRATRVAWQEPCLEFNQLKQFVSQVVNDQLQNQPGIRVHPAGGDASEEVAEIMQGLIRGIEYDSKAKDTYKNGFKLAVSGGRGWWRVCSEYEADDGFDQKLVVKPILDSNTVFADTAYTMPDGSDRNFVFVVSTFTKDQFAAKWPKADPVSWDRMPAYWTDGKDTIVVADYYRRVCKSRTMVRMSDGMSGWKDTMPDLPPGVTIKAERSVETWSVEWFTIGGGQQLLEEYEWPGTMIPVICCAGEDLILDGKRVYQGLTTPARDAQSMLNFGMTQQATQLALSPRAPWVMAEGQNEGYEEMWRDANTKNWSELIYKPTTIGGVLVPPPRRTEPAMVSQGWDHWVQTMLGMIKSSMGMYEQSLGMKGNETSGRAIIAREKQGDTATFNFVHNWHMAIDLTGRIVVECIPTFYDAQRIVSIIGNDDTKELVTINEASVEPDETGALQAITKNDITKGRYAVTVESGPSFSTKRQESAELLSQMVTANPALMQVAGDLIMKAQDIPDADVIAERLHLTLPPQILEAEKAKEAEKNGQPAGPDPQQMMGQMQEMKGHLDQAAQTMQSMQDHIDGLESGAQAKDAQAQRDMQFKQHQAELDHQFATEKALRDEQFAMDQARRDGLLALEKAGIEADTLIQKAKIAAETQIILKGMEPPQALTVGDPTGEPKA